MICGSAKIKATLRENNHSKMGIKHDLSGTTCLNFVATEGCLHIVQKASDLAEEGFPYNMISIENRTCKCIQIIEKVSCAPALWRNFNEVT